ncbi:hypothetical protein [Streptomyces harbinensis]|nr:hypothetical protein [Streptomyces harbinensis]
MTIELTPDGRGWVDGQALMTEDGTDTTQLRAAALREVTGAAVRGGRSVVVEATDPDGAVWTMVVHPSGRVETGAAVDELAADPEGTRPPAAYRDWMAEIWEAGESGRHLDALSMATKIQEQATADYGTRHPYAWRAREVAAHVALLCGTPGRAAEMYMEAARGWAELGSAAYWAAAQRAYACWHQVPEAAQGAWLGEQLAELLRLGGDEALPTLRLVLARTDELRGG